jgi:hypothetical protein
VGTITQFPVDIGVTTTGRSVTVEVGPTGRAGNYKGGDASEFYHDRGGQAYPGSVSGGGYTLNTAQSAPMRATSARRPTMASTYGTTRGQESPGHVNIIIRRGGKLYQIKTTSVNTFVPVVNPVGGTANFETKANLTDLSNGSSVAGGLTLRMVIDDKGEPGVNDTIVISLWNGGTLWFTSEWDGTQPVPKKVDGGNLQVR